jgi:hypothetical protein
MDLGFVESNVESNEIRKNCKVKLSKKGFLLTWAHDFSVLMFSFNVQLHVPTQICFVRTLFALKVAPMVRQTLNG